MYIAGYLNVILHYSLDKTNSLELNMPENNTLIIKSNILHYIFKKIILKYNFIFWNEFFKI